MRINKFLTDANFCSRREADRLVQQGRVKVNGRKAVLGQQVESNDKVSVDGKAVQAGSQKVYLLYNKPAGVIVTTDKRSPDNIIEKINYPQRVYPVGRLDVNTSGLILLTNDGAVVNQILKGENKVEKEYEVKVDKVITEDFVQGLKKGIKLPGEEHPTLRAKVAVLGEKSLRITIVEGKNRQVRKMCSQLGYNVKKLKRVRIGNLSLDRLDLASGGYVEISEKEIGEIIGERRG